MKKLFYTALLLVLTFAAQAKGVENRFLFIIDTASAMRGYSNVVQQSVVELLKSDLKGELRDGDTIGFWTYNDKLHPEFPMQVWSHKTKNTIITSVADFLRDQKYQKRAHLDKVLPAMQDVIAHSEKITVIFIFDGSGTIRGTRFDTDINDLQKQYARELRSAHVPFVTILVAKQGSVFDYTINYPGMVAIPHTAEPEPPPVTNAPPIVVAPAPPPKPQRKIEIILSGPTNVVHAAPAPTPTPVSVPTPAPAPVVVEVPKPVEKPIVPALPPADVVTNQPTNVVSAEPPASEAPVAPPPAIVPAPRPSVVIPPAPATSNAMQIALFIMAFSLLTIAIVLVVFLVRRFRGGSQPSLISQSIDRSR